MTLAIPTISKTLRRCVAWSIAVGLICSLAAAQDSLGPLVGYVTPDEATIWMSVAENAEIAIEYREESAPVTSIQTVRENVDASKRITMHAHLKGLKPATAYVYDVVVAGKRNDQWKGHFTTAPPVGKPVHFKAAVSSCMKVADNPSQPSWNLMLADAPQFHILLGDNVYADSTDPKVLWDHHRRQRQVPQFATLIRDLPTYAVWDDHDYGLTNSDGNQKGKEDSLAVFKALFISPMYGLPDAPGVFYKFSWGDIDFFMLDVRYHRSPNRAPNDENKRMLGDAQFAWLEQGLKQSQAKFKVIGSGSPLTAMPPDGWNNYDFERKRLFELISRQKITGVLFLTGEIHRCQVMVHPAEQTIGYPLYEIISSGIANSRDQGYATLEFDTTLADPTLRIKLRHKDDTTPTDRTVKLSELCAP